MHRSSIGLKFILIIVSCFLSVTAISFAIFSDIYLKQMEAEAKHLKLRADRLLSLMAENKALKDQLSWHRTFETEEDTDQLELIRQSLFEERGMEFSRQRLLDRTIQMGTFALIVVGIILILMIILLRFFVTRPVERLLEVSKRFSEGDFSARVALKKTRFYDEIETLGIAFNRMADNLQGTWFKLEERERFLQNLIDAIPDGIRVIDEEYREVMSNKAFKNLLGQKVKKDGSGFCYFSSYGRNMPCEEGMVTCPLRALKKEKKPIAVIHRFINASGEEVPVEINAAILDYKKLKDGQHKMLIIESVRDLGRDIRFSHQQKLSSVGLVATSVAHDLRNSLGAIRLILENLPIKQKDTELLKYIGLSKEQISACLDTTTRLLSIGRYSDGKEKISLTRLLKDTAALMDYESKRNGVHVFFDDKTPEFFTEGNESDVRMVFLNIFQNALNAMPKGGKLILSIRKKGRFTEISFADTGVGIAKDDQQRIFDPFYRPSFVKKGAGTGLGLGLAICRTLVKSMGGDIQLVSAAGKGATFKLLFKRFSR